MQELPGFTSSRKIRGSLDLEARGVDLHAEELCSFCNEHKPVLALVEFRDSALYLRL